MYDPTYLAKLRDPAFREEVAARQRRELGRWMLPTLDDFVIEVDR